MVALRIISVNFQSYDINQVVFILVGLQKDMFLLKDRREYIFIYSDYNIFPLFFENMYSFLSIEYENPCTKILQPKLSAIETNRDHPRVYRKIRKVLRHLLSKLQQSGSHYSYRLQKSTLALFLHITLFSWSTVYSFFFNFNGQNW